MKYSLIVISIAAVIVGYMYYSKAEPKAVLTDSDFEYNAPYTCSGLKIIQTAFAEKGGVIRLSLSDKRVFILEKTSIQDSGTAYANDDRSVVFFVKDEGAYLEENGTATYSGCSVIF